MNRSQFIDILSKRTGLDKKDVKRTIDEMQKLIVQEIKEGQRICLHGFGAYFGDTHPAISVISTQFVSYKMALGCKFIISFLNSHLLSQNDAKSVQFCPGSHQQ